MITLETRDDILSLLSPRSVMAELGVLKGDFSDKILKTINPSELVLIDSWDGEIFSGDVNGNNTQLYEGEELYNFVVKKFDQFKNVRIFRNKTDKIQEFKNDYFDFIYIDADHSYDAVKIDLENCFLKIKNNGILAGHDYGINPNKTNNQYDFGVKKAVDEFCIKHNQKINYVCMDGCTSFAIRICK